MVEQKDDNDGLDDSEFEELTDICNQFSQQNKQRGKNMTEEEVVMRLLIEGTHKEDGEEDSDDDEGYMFVLFRKVFDKMPDRKKHYDYIESVNDDFAKTFFDIETDPKELHGMVTMNNLGEQQI